MYVIALDVIASPDGSPAYVTIAYMCGGIYETACCGSTERPWTSTLDGALDVAERVVAHDAVRVQRLLERLIAAEGFKLPDLGIECVRTRARRLFPDLEDDGLPALCERLGLEMPANQAEATDAIAAGEVSAALDRLEVSLRRGLAPTPPQPRHEAALAA